MLGVYLGSCFYCYEVVDVLRVVLLENGLNDGEEDGAVLLLHDESALYFRVDLKFPFQALKFR